MIPDYQSLMLPLLKCLADRKEHARTDVIEELAREFDITVDERSQKLPSGTQAVFDSRVGWAATYLLKAGLIGRPQRGRMAITDRGAEVLSRKPGTIDNAFLAQFPEFKAFAGTTGEREKKGGKSPPDEGTDKDLSPEEALRRAHQKLDTELASDLLETVKSHSSDFFERVVVDLLLRLGYGGGDRSAAQVTRRSVDEGIDGIIKEDALGLDNVYIQAKRYKDDTVGRPSVQAFVGALFGQHASKGVFITTSAFSNEAKKYASAITQKVILIDGDELARLMIRTGVGVATTETFELKRIDSDYFEEE